MEVSSLKRGERYVFHLKPFEPAIGEPMPQEAKARKFVGVEHVGAAGMPKPPFFEVGRDNGTRDLIAVETIEAIEPV